MSNNPIKSREEIDLEEILDRIDVLLEAAQEEANKLPDCWQENCCDDFTDKLNDARRIAKEGDRIIMEQVAQPADIEEYRPGLSPLDMATVLGGGAIDHIKTALDALSKLEPGLSTFEKNILDIIRSVLNTATEKQREAMEKIREHQRIPGSN